MQKGRQLYAMQVSLVVIMMFLAVLSSADELGNDNFDLSLSAVLVFPGNIQASFYNDFPSGATVQFKTKISPAFRLAVEYYSPAMAGFAPCIALKLLRSNILRGDRLGFLGRQESYDPERRTSFYSNRSRC